MAALYGTEMTSSRENAVCSDCILTENCVFDFVIRCIFYAERGDWLYVRSAGEKTQGPCS